MFEQREDLQQMVEALVGLSEPLKRGDLLTREAIQSVLLVEPNTAHWGHCVRRARRRIEHDRGIATWPVVGFGFRLLTENETLTMLPRKRRMKAIRQMRRSWASVAALPLQGLSQHQMIARAAQLASLKKTQDAIAEEMRVSEVMARSSETLPRARPIARPSLEPVL